MIPSRCAAGQSDAVRFPQADSVENEGDWIRGSKVRFDRRSRYAVLVTKQLRISEGGFVRPRVSILQNKAGRARELVETGQGVRSLQHRLNSTWCPGANIEKCRRCCESLACSQTPEADRRGLLAIREPREGRTLAASGQTSALLSITQPCTRQDTSAFGRVDCSGCPSGEGEYLLLLLRLFLRAPVLGTSSAPLAISLRHDYPFLSRAHTLRYSSQA